jgi:hypothetical protein
MSSKLKPLILTWKKNITVDIQVIPNKIF